MNWLKSKILKLIAPKYIGSLTRTLIAALGGFLATTQLPPELVAKVLAFLTDITPDIIAGLSGYILYALAQGWSFLDKKDK